MSSFRHAKNYVRNFWPNVSDSSQFVQRLRKTLKALAFEKASAFWEFVVSGWLGNTLERRTKKQYTHLRGRMEITIESPTPPLSGYCNV